MHLRTYVYMLIEYFPRGAEAVQRLIDAGAYITWKEENGLEMIAEFTRSVGTNILQSNKISGGREPFF